MAEQQKVTDDLTRIEIDIEDAITNNDLETARAELARLIEQSPDHPRREFLQTSIDRAAELQKFAGQSQPPAAAGRCARPEITAPRATRARESAGASGRTRARTKRSAPQSARDTSPPLRSRAPMARRSANRRAHPRSRSMRRSIRRPRLRVIQRDNNFSGRTVEASDSAVGRGSSRIRMLANRRLGGRRAGTATAAAAPRSRPPPST